MEVKISVILPVYNGKKYIMELAKRIRDQKGVGLIEIIAPVSPSQDDSLEEATKYCDMTYQVKKFNHGRTRHEAALMAQGDILVFITQDVMPIGDRWLESLVAPLLKKKVAATYARQLAYDTASETEKLIRKFNYPDYDRLCSKETVSRWGRKNIFYSDSCSATRRDVFLQLGGYDFEVVTNEDVVYALKVLKEGHSILYNSKAHVYHSHDYTFKESYERYRLIGRFEKEFEEVLSDYNSLGEGKKLLFYLITNLIKKVKLGELVRLPLDMAVRYLGYKRGFNDV